MAIPETKDATEDELVASYDNAVAETVIIENLETTKRLAKKKKK